ncbi:hypothetical protein STEG23_024889, partial [Scotinomys teguina]
MARKAGQGKEEEESMARQQEVGETLQLGRQNLAAPIYFREDMGIEEPTDSQLSLWQ